MDPTYDQEHNLISYNGSNFLYDWNHHLFSATNGTSDIESRYDGLGRCVSRTVNGTLTYVFYDGWNPMLETNSSGVQTAARIYGAGADEIIEGFGSSGSSGVFYHQDNVGNVTGLTDSGSNLVETYIYDPFGRPSIFDGSGTIPRSTSAYGNRFMFQGREYLAAVNTYDFRARAYSPDLGRFLQMDPIGFGGGNHLYRFAGNNPVTGRDPIGLDYWVALYSSDGNGTGGYDGQGSPGGAVETTPYTRGEVSDEDSWSGYGGWAAANAGQNVQVNSIYNSSNPDVQDMQAAPPSLAPYNPIPLEPLRVTAYDNPVSDLVQSVFNWLAGGIQAFFTPDNAPGSSFFIAATFLVGPETESGPIVLSLEEFGLHATAAKLGGQTLMRVNNFRATLQSAIDFNAEIVVSLDGVSGESTYAKFMSAAQQGLGLGGAATPFNSEMGLIYQNGYQSQIQFWENGVFLENPFQ